MHAVIWLLLQSRKFWWYLLLSSSTLCHNVNDVIPTSFSVYLFAVPINLVNVNKGTPHTCNSWTAASRNARLYCVQPVSSKQPRSQSCRSRDLGSHAAVSTIDKFIVWINWNSGSLMSGAVLNSQFLTRLLTSGIVRVFLLKDTSITACERTMLISSTSVTFSVPCLTIASLIMKSCQKPWPIHSCSFYKVVHLADLGFGGKF